MTVAIAFSVAVKTFFVQIPEMESPTTTSNTSTNDSSNCILSCRENILHPDSRDERVTYNSHSVFIAGFRVYSTKP
jgi:hypothetical protein